MDFETGKKLVREILLEQVDCQLNANLGGIVGGEEYEEIAEKDLQRFSDALDWYDKNIMNKTK